jgi:hypothetical protein
MSPKHTVCNRDGVEVKFTCAYLREEMERLQCYRFSVYCFICLMALKSRLTMRQEKPKQDRNFFG